MCCALFWILFSADTLPTTDNKKNIFIQYIPLSPVPLCKSYSLESTGKTRFPCGGGGEVHSPHPVPNTSLFFFPYPLFFKSQQVCVCLLVTAVLSRGVTLGTMTPHKAASGATTRATIGTPCQMEWWLVS